MLATFLLWHIIQVSSEIDCAHRVAEQAVRTMKTKAPAAREKIFGNKVLFSPFAIQMKNGTFRKCSTGFSRIHLLCAVSVNPHRFDSIINKSRLRPMIPVFDEPY